MDNYQKRFIEIQFYALINQFYYLQGTRDFKNVQELLRFTKVLQPELDLETIQNVLTNLDNEEHRPTKHESVVVCLHNNVSSRCIKEFYKLSGTSFAQLRAKEQEDPMFITSTFEPYEIAQMEIVLNTIKKMEEFGICQNKSFRTFSDD